MNLVTNFLLITVLVCSSEYQFAFANTDDGEVTVRCLMSERKSLLKFKEGLVDEYDVMSSWGKENECCKWKGVQCSNTTGRVIALQLVGQYWSTGSHYLGGEINSALSELHSLKVLDLSGNDFGTNKIPEFIFSFSNLQHLNLSRSLFSGIVPSHLWNLTNLETVDLSYNRFSGIIPPQIGNLANLETLRLSYNQFFGTLPLEIGKLTNLETLLLSYNQFSGTLPLEIGNLTNLETLDLSGNYDLSGTLPLEIGNLTNLYALDLSYNQFLGNVPPQLCRLTNLKTLRLSHNQFLGNVPPQIWSLTNLEILHLYYNHFSGTVPPQIGNLINLEALDLSGNNFSGALPTQLWQLLKLEELRVSFNSLEDTITEADLSKLANLKNLDLSPNSLTLDISPDWTPPFQLSDILLSGCKLGPHFPLWLRSSTNFTWLDLSLNGIVDEVPKWLSNLSQEVYYLNLSHNQLSGTLNNLSSMVIDAIDVSSNNFSGPIPLFSPSTWYFQMSQNMFSGSFSFICGIPYALWVLDLSDNQLSGKLPNCWGNMTRLSTLNLANNHFFGEIPHSLGYLSELYVLHFANNNFSGKLPSTLKNCKTLQFVDIGDNMLTGSIPTWISEYHETMIYLIIRNNMFYGSIPPQICHLSQIQVLDLSGNDVSGEIPPCFHNFTYFVENNISDQNFQSSFPLSDHEAEIIKYTMVSWKRKEYIYGRNLLTLKLVDLSRNKLVGNIPRSFSTLKGLRSLNLSRNIFTGIIDPDIGQMELLESLDLSSNQLSGVIPVGMAKLHFLGLLDLSNNNLSGEIPIGSQLQTFNASAYAGNIGLCGIPLPSCSGESLDHRDDGEIVDDDAGILSLSFMKEIGIPIILGFIVGFWGVVGSLIVNVSWRRVFYNFLGAVGDWLYVRVTIFWTKLFRRS